MNFPYEKSNTHCSAIPDIATLGLIEPADLVNRVLAAAPLLQDPVRGVRVEAARILADVPDSQFPAAQHRARQSALHEYIATLQQDADWPTANVNLGNLYLRQGNAEQAIAAYKRALLLDAQFAGHSRHSGLHVSRSGQCSGCAEP